MSDKKQLKEKYLVMLSYMSYRKIQGIPLILIVNASTKGYQVQPTTQDCKSHSQTSNSHDSQQEHARHILSLSVPYTTTCHSHFGIETLKISFQKIFPKTHRQNKNKLLLLNHLPPYLINSFITNSGEVPVRAFWRIIKFELAS